MVGAAAVPEDADPEDAPEEVLPEEASFESHAPRHRTRTSASATARICFRKVHPSPDETGTGLPVPEESLLRKLDVIPGDHIPQMIPARDILEIGIPNGDSIRD